VLCDVAFDNLIFCVEQKLVRSVYSCICSRLQVDTQAHNCLGFDIVKVAYRVVCLLSSSPSHNVAWATGGEHRVHAV